MPLKRMFKHSLLILTLIFLSVGCNSDSLQDPTNIKSATKGVLGPLANPFIPSDNPETKTGNPLTNVGWAINAPGGSQGNQIILSIFDLNEDNKIDFTEVYLVILEILNGDVSSLKDDQGNFKLDFDLVRCFFPRGALVR